MARKQSIPGSMIPKNGPVSTLICILLVLLIAAVIVGICVPSYSSGAEPKVNATKISLYNIKQALTEFNRDCGRYPTTAEGIDALVHPPKGLVNWHQYTDKLPKDGWGNPLIYILRARRRRFRSLFHRRGRNRRHSG